MPYFPLRIHFPTSFLFLCFVCITGPVFGQLIETGANDRRVTFTGPDGDDTYDSFSPKVAYNSTDNNYFIVWSADDNTGPLVEGEFEIYGQLYNLNGPIGNPIKISQMGPDGNNNFDAAAPAIAFNTARNEYMVVWHGDHNVDGLLDNEFEIFGRRISSTGVPVGLQLRISDIGPTGDDTYDANSPEIAYNSMDDEYIVVWSSEEVLEGMVNNEFEIFGQRLDGLGNEIGSNDFRISDNGPEGEHATDAVSPWVTYNSVDNEYLVVWEGVLDPFPPFNNLCDDEIFGQLLDADGNEIGENDFRISFNFPVDGNCSYDVEQPNATYNPHLNQYFVVWRGQDEEARDGEFVFQLAKEIYGMLLDSEGTLLLDNDRRLSDVGGDDPQRNGEELEAGNPAVVYNPSKKEYLVTFEADEDIGGQINREFEIFVQRVDELANELGSNDQRISSLGGLGDADYDAGLSHLVYDSSNDSYLVVFQGDDNRTTQVDGESEIFAQLLKFASATANNDCSLESIDITDELLSQSGDSDFRATQSITSNATLATTFSALHFQAPNAVEMNNGFEVDEGVSLVIDISNCVSK